jgi:hypothetical protein
MIEDVNALEDIKSRHGTTLLYKEHGQLPSAN